MTPQAVGGGLLVVLGVALIGLAALGLFRMPDAYNRANAVTKAAGLGVVCVLLGVVVLSPSVSSVLTLLLAAVLQLFTVPIAGLAIGEAAWRAGAPLVAGTRQDRLAAAPVGDPPGGERSERPSG
ncbi:monovalent cation/H(+) antiporter subunit G [Blastococcus sp. PRF04-17]|uniref:monovalent cation/H(+) antiporter subunit G n=1 Tax=Blastococcus sp. PRF04-17 TaxID=2933797 RepID=UPI001FF65CFD|nr:monovalent cation/H(+) antiporter subunit G [Blastococcus sp. PRF04-17]UOX99957.1 monovalent cation/H(+) antiporter subunit G [Blastococcus sp. PRF04-17]